MTRLSAMFALWLALPGLAAAAVPAWSLLPQPAQVQMDTAHALRVGDGATVAAQGAPAQAIRDRFMRLVARTRGLHLRVATPSAAWPTIRFVLDPQAAVEGAAGYRLTVDGTGILVEARAPRGLYYGSITLWQLLTPRDAPRGAPVEVAYGRIDDHPRFAWRALMLDSGRHFQRVAEIKQLLDAMARAKLNVLVWHLTEDQGWRLAIPAYPELTRVGACRQAVGLDGELTGSPATPYCGYYSAADVREVVAYAAARYIEVVPDLDLPGHSQAAVASYPWLGVTGQRPPVWTDWGVSSWLLQPDARTPRFVDTVLDEVMRLFPSPYVSIGGDEADKSQWNASPAVQAQRRRLHLPDMNALQGWFTAQVADYLVRHGRTPLGWDDQIAEGAQLPAAEVVMSWHGNDDERVALSALRQGHAVVMTPQESLYFDHYQSALPDEWPGQPPMVTLRAAYDTRAIPPGANPAEAARVLGVQAGLWSELLPSDARIEHALFPRLAALAELGWSPAAAHDWPGFLARLPAELARYRALGIAYADSAFVAAFAVSDGGDGTLRVALSSQTGLGTLRYTTDGSAPTAASAAYTQPLRFPGNGHTTLRVASFADDGFALSAPRTQVLGAATLRSRDGSALATCSGQPAMRLGGAGSAHGGQPTYAVDVGNMCWQWHQAPLHGMRAVSLRIGRVPWRFGDEASGASVRTKASGEGEFTLHADSCHGLLLASLPLPRALPAGGQATLTASLALPQDSGARDLCLVASGDPRDGQWTLAQIRLIPQTSPRPLPSRPATTPRVPQHPRSN